MNNTPKPIIAAPTAHRDPLTTDLVPVHDGRRNILTDALCEIGYDINLIDTLADILIERNVIDFDYVSYTRHIMDQLSEHYGDEAVYGCLADVLACEGLDISLTGELAEKWRDARGDTFRERVRHIINDPIEKLGVKITSRHELKHSSTFSEELENVKKNLATNYTEFDVYLPRCTFVIYAPTNSVVIAVISCMTDLKNMIVEQAYWSLKLQEKQTNPPIKFYLITTDIGKTLKITNPPNPERVIAEAEFDGTYVLTAEDIEETDKIKLFEHFIDDLKHAILESQ